MPPHPGRRIRRRHAATACLGIVAEGCAEGLSKVAPDVTPLVVRALRDPSPDVRGAAAFTLGQFAEFLNYPDESAAHAVALPELFAAMPTEADRKVQERMMYAMDCGWRRSRTRAHTSNPCFASCSWRWTARRRPQVREMLLAPPRRRRRRRATPCIPISPRCFPGSSGASPTETPILSLERALEVLGMLARPRRPRAMAPHVPAAMAARRRVRTRLSELREYGHAMFAEVAEALGEDCAVLARA